MPTDTDRMILELSAQMRQFEKAMLKAAGDADRAAQRVERRFQAMNRRVTQDFQRFQQQVAGVLAAIGVGFIARDVTRLADTWTTVGNRLAFAGVQAERLETVQHAVADVASRTRSELDATADLFSRMFRSSEDLGASLTEVLRVTEIVSKALAGAAQSERQGAIRQLGQGLASGRLQGDELRSILENSRPIAEAIAAEFETTVGNLRELGKQGQLESRRIFLAILRAGDDIDAAFGRTTFTVADAFVRLRTEAARFVGTNEQTSSSVRSLTRLIDYVANNFQTLADAVIVTATVMGGAFAGTAIARTVIALQAVTRSATLAKSALAFFGGPLGIVLTVAGGALAYVASQTDLLTSSTQALQRASDSSYAALQKIASFTDDLQTLADAGEGAAGSNSEIAETAEDARRALDEMSEASSEASDNLDGQGRITVALAEAERERTLTTLRQAIADQEAAIAAIRRAEAVSQLLRVLQGNFDVADPFGLDRADGQREQIERAERLIEIFEEAVRAGENISLETWQSLFELRAGGAAADESAADATARKLADLAASHELTLARLQHEEARVRELEDAAEIVKRTAAYEEAGIATAEARLRAEQEVRAEREAMNAEAQRSYEISQLQDEIDLARISNHTALVNSLQDELEIRRRTRELVDQLALSEAEAYRLAREYVDALREARTIELEHQLELRNLEEQAEAARLRGDHRAEQAINRRLELEERISELRRIGLSEEAAVDRARQEVEALERADLQGKFRDWFRGGVRAALDGDFGDYFQNWIAERAAEGLDRALDLAADALFDAFEPIIAGVIENGTSIFSGEIAGAIGSATGQGIGKLTQDAIEAGEALSGVLGAAAADAGTKLALSGAASAASAAKETASSALKAGAAKAEVVAMLALTKAASAAAAALAAVAASGGASSKGGIVGGIVGSIIKGFTFGGGKASGGPVNPGILYQVHKDELIVPRVPSIVIPKMAPQQPGGTYVDARKFEFHGTGEELRAELLGILHADQQQRRDQIIAGADDGLRRRHFGRNR